MNATVLLPPHKSAAELDDLTIAFDVPANDGAPAGSFAPEAPLIVSFEGLSSEQAEHVLRAFPGARRVILATP